MIVPSPLQGLVHITGGGFPENIPRVVPKGLATKVNRSAWEVPPLFKWLQEVSGWTAEAATLGGTKRSPPPVSEG